VIYGIIFLTKEVGALSFKRGGRQQKLKIVLQEVNVIRNQRKKKKRCMPAIRKGEEFANLSRGGIE
jgi:hypothetical protein